MYVGERGPIGDYDNKQEERIMFGLRSVMRLYIRIVRTYGSLCIYISPSLHLSSAIPYRLTSLYVYLHLQHMPSSLSRLITK